MARRCCQTSAQIVGLWAITLGAFGVGFVVGPPFVKLLLLGVTLDALTRFDCA